MMLHALFASSLFWALTAADSRATPPQSYTLLVVSSEPREARDDIAQSVRHALMAAGISIVVFPPARPDCGQGCAHLKIATAGSGRFTMELRQGAYLRREPVEVPPSASRFDVIHAVVVQAELLLADLPRRRMPRTGQEKTAAQSVVAVGPVPAALEGPAASLSASPPAATGTDVAVTDSPSVARRPSSEPASPSPDRLGLDVGATMLKAVGPDVFAGISLGLRLAISDAWDTRLGVTLFDANRSTDADGTKHWRRPLVFWASTTVGVTRNQNVRLGLGPELVSLVDNLEPGELSPGARAQLELRYPLRKVTLRSLLHASLHPFDEQNESGFPMWSFGAELGMEFGIL
jgi:hypothetical protein